MDQSLLIRTSTRWNIPRELALAVISRDKCCVYCGRVFGEALIPRSAVPSWEHIVNDLSLVDAANIALCCFGCNASKGKKSLEQWLESKYCSERGITRQSLASVALGAMDTAI